MIGEYRENQQTELYRWSAFLPMDVLNSMGLWEAIKTHDRDGIPTLINQLMYVGKRSVQSAISPF